MPHRVQSIVDAAVAAIAARPALGAAVYRHRRNSLSSDDMELPAVSVSFGEDSALSDFGVTNLSFLDSGVVLTATAVTAGASEQDVVEELLRLRREIHIGFMADVTLGLAYVMACYYHGASEPVISGAGERFSGALDTRWRVDYRTSLTDPGA
jgi:hypothetical protein